MPDRKVITKIILNLYFGLGIKSKIKTKLLPEFLCCGELGINFLIECLEDDELEIRAKAYELLQDVESEKARKAIASGVLLNPGDVSLQRL